MYSFAYFINPQMYFCRDAQGQRFECDLAYVCSEHEQNKFVDYEIDKTYAFYHWNWY